MIKIIPAEDGDDTGWGCVPTKVSMEMEDIIDWIIRLENNFLPQCVEELWHRNKKGNIVSCCAVGMSLAHDKNFVYEFVKDMWKGNWKDIENDEIHFVLNGFPSYITDMFQRYTKSMMLANDSNTSFPDIGKSMFEWFVDLLKPFMPRRKD